MQHPQAKPRAVPLAPATRVPDGVPVSTILHRVAFYQTDAMGVMHHANYLHLLENARVRWLADHQRPYTEYVREGHHFAVTRVDLHYHRPARFDDLLETTVWIDWVRRASLALAYVLRCDGQLVAYGHTEHALVRTDGRLVRIPADQRERLSAQAARGTGIRRA